MCAGSPPTAASVSTGRRRAAPLAPSARTASMASGSARMAWRSCRSVSCDVANGFEHVASLRQDGFLEVRIVGDRNVLRGDPLDRGIEVLEQMLRDARGKLGAEPAGQLIFMRDD